MTSAEFSTMCRDIFGSYGWKAKAARKLGIARSTVHFYAKGVCYNGNLATIKQETVIKLSQLHKEFLEELLVKE